MPSSRLTMAFPPRSRSLVCPKSCQVAHRTAGKGLVGASVLGARQAAMTACAPRSLSLIARRTCRARLRASHWHSPPPRSSEPESNATSHRPTTSPVHRSSVDDRFVAWRLPSFRKPRGTTIDTSVESVVVSCLSTSVSVSCTTESMRGKPCGVCRDRRLLCKTTVQ